MKVYQGKLNAKGLKIAIIASKFNRLITDRLVEGAINVLKQLDLEEEDLSLFYVPGSFEIPVILSRILETKIYDAVICLGTLIKGDTPHFEYIASNVTRSIMDLSVKYSTPVTFGIITANSADEAIDRAGLKMGNKGEEAALAAVEMANTLKQNYE